MLYLLSTAVVLLSFWLILSGMFEPFLLGAGMLSVVAVVTFMRRMEVIDHEGHPVHLGWRGLIYFPWLIGQIIKSSLSVGRVILTPSMPISPTLGAARASQKTGVGLTLFANSITLTPGTISIETGSDEVLVHALTVEALQDLNSGEMDRRVTRVEGEA